MLNWSLGRLQGILAHVKFTSLRQESHIGARLLMDSACASHLHSLENHHPAVPSWRSSVPNDHQGG